MATLSDQYIDNSYKDLLQVSNSNAGVDATVRDVEDGEGTASALQLSTSIVNVNGTFKIGGYAITRTGNYTLDLTLTGNTALTFPTSGTIVTTTGTQTLTNKTLTTPIIAQISNTGTLTLPTSTDTLVGKATTDTLTNKTLTAPVIATIVNSGTLTLPTSTDTLVGRATTDTLTNKTLTSPTINTPTVATPSISGTVTISGALANTSLRVLDTNASHALVITPGSNITADRIFTLTTGDAARTLTMGGDVSIDGNAVQADQETGTSTTKFVTPASQQSHASATKFWMKGQPGGTTILASSNVASVVRIGTGNYAVTFTTAFSSAHYCVSVTAFDASVVLYTMVTSQAAGTVVIKMYNSSGVATDPSDAYYISGWGDL